YREFIVPGLIVMAMVQAAYSNNSSSVFQARSDRYINDVLSAPMHEWQMNLGFNVGGVLRSIAIGLGLFAVALPLTGVPVREPLVLIPAVVLGMVLFGALGTIVGIYAETFDNHTFVNNIVILPLAFLGGTFYSIHSLASPWQELSHVNPVFYLVNAVRYGFLGQRGAIYVLGRAPAPHGGNRTGRVFPGARSGDWLFASMHRTGLANQPTSIRADDGLELRGAFVAAAVRCAPPANRPLPAERDNCLP